MNSRKAASVYFGLPVSDDFSKKVGGDPTRAMVELYSYTGAKAYALANKIEFPGATVLARL